MRDKKKLIDRFIRGIYYKDVEECLITTKVMIECMYFRELFYVYVNYYCKYIHINNIKYIILLNKKFIEFKNIANNSRNDNELISNNIVRKIFYILSIVLVSLNKEYTITNFESKFKNNILEQPLKANNIEYIRKYYKENDPKEYLIAFNELVYHIEETKDISFIFYWVDWIINYEVSLFKEKKQLFCHERKIYKDNRNIIFILWDIILELGNEKNNKYLRALLELFLIKYNRSSNKKYKSVILVSLLLLTKDNIDYNITLFDNYRLMEEYSFEDYFK
jgi:hypothetical protein